MIDIPLDQIVLADDAAAEESVFVLKVPRSEYLPELLAQIGTAWDQAWKQANRNPPALLILPADYDLSSLTDDQLFEAGLVRISGPGGGL